MKIALVTTCSVGP